MGLRGRGKRGGARIIYYFHNQNMPLLAIDAYAKNERTDLKPDEIARLKRTVKLIADQFAKRMK